MGLLHFYGTWRGEGNLNLSLGEFQFILKVFFKWGILTWLLY